jgi:hypothetical protein
MTCPKAFRLSLTIALAAMLASCSVTKKLFTHKEKSKTEENHDINVSTRQAADRHWEWTGSSLLRRDGQVSIRFDSLAVLDISPDGHISATGFNPIISTTHSVLSTDTTSEIGQERLIINKDSTAKSRLKAKDYLFEQEKEVEKQTDMPAWIFGIGLLLFFIWIVRKANRFVP